MKNLKLQKALLAICLALPLTLTINKATNAMENPQMQNGSQNKQNPQSVASKNSHPQELHKYLSDRNLTELRLRLQEYSQFLIHYIDNNLATYLALLIQANYELIQFPAQIYTDNNTTQRNISRLLIKNRPVGVAKTFMTEEAKTKEIQEILEYFKEIANYKPAYITTTNKQPDQNIAAKLIIQELFISDGDYTNRDDKIDSLKRLIEKNIKKGLEPPIQGTKLAKILNLLEEIATQIQNEANNKKFSIDKDLLQQLANQIKTLHTAYRNKQKYQEEERIRREEEEERIRREEEEERIRREEEERLRKEEEERIRREEEERIRREEEEGNEEGQEQEQLPKLKKRKEELIKRIEETTREIIEKNNETREQKIKEAEQEYLAATYNKNNLEKQCNTLKQNKPNYESQFKIKQEITKLKRNIKNLQTIIDWERLQIMDNKNLPDLPEDYQTKEYQNYTAQLASVEEQIAKLQEAERKQKEEKERLRKEEEERLRKEEEERKAKEEEERKAKEEEEKKRKKEEAEKKRKKEEEERKLEKERLKKEEKERKAKEEEEKKRKKEEEEEQAVHIAIKEIQKLIHKWIKQKQETNKDKEDKLNKLEQDITSLEQKYDKIVKGIEVNLQ